MEASQFRMARADGEVPASGTKVHHGCPEKKQYISRFAAFFEGGAWRGIRSGGPAQDIGWRRGVVLLMPGLSLLGTLAHWACWHRKSQPKGSTRASMLQACSALWLVDALCQRR